MGWHFNDLTAATGAPLALSFGNPVGYAFNAQATQHVVFRTRDDRVGELRWDSSGWHYNDLITAAGGAPSPTMFIRAGYVFDAQGTQHVVYLAGGQIIELWWDNNGWHHNDLTAATGTPAGDLPYGYVFDAQDTQHVIYSAQAGHLIELWWDSSGWHHNDLTVAAGGAPPSIGLGRPIGYAFDAQRTQHVIYKTSDDHIGELWWDSSGWHYNDLTVAAGGAPLPASQPTAGYVFDAQGTQHVVYLAGGGQIIELWWDNDGWHQNNLTAAAGGAPPANSDPIGYVFGVQSTQHVVYWSGEGHMIELWWDSSGWHHNDLTVAAGGAPLAGFRPAGYVFDAQCTQHVVYFAGDGQGIDGHIIELWWKWTKQ